MLKPRALAPGDRIGIVAPASPFSRDEFDAGLVELRRLGFDPVHDDSVFERSRSRYTAGDATVRAMSFRRAWNDPSIRALVAVRGGYGSVQLLPYLDREEIRRAPKAFIGYSDNTSLLTWLNGQCGMVSFHGPMLEGRLSKGSAGYDLDTFMRVLAHPEPAGAITHPQVETLHRGEATGQLTGGTLTQLAASLGTPYAFDPPHGHILFIDEVAERPYRIDRLLMQLRLGGILERAAGIVFGELPRCDEPVDGGPAIRDVLRDVLDDFHGPILFGLPSGHTSGASLTLPFGVQACVLAGAEPMLVIEEAAVV